MTRAAHTQGGRRSNPARVRGARPSRGATTPGGLEEAGPAAADAGPVDGERRARPHRLLEGAQRPSIPGRAEAAGNARPRREPDQPPRLQTLAATATERAPGVASPCPRRRGESARAESRGVVRSTPTLAPVAPRFRRALGGAPDERHRGGAVSQRRAPRRILSQPAAAPAVAKRSGRKGTSIELGTPRTISSASNRPSSGPSVTPL